MDKKIPTLFGIILTLALVGVLAFLFQYFTATFSQASGSFEPKNITYSNISDVMFTVSWITESPATGFISVSGGQKNTPVYDERDLSDKSLGKYSGHSVTVTGLEPDTGYTIKIISGGKTFSADVSQYSIRTGPIINTPAAGLGPAYGSVSNNNLPAEGGLVYLTVEGGQLLSSLVSKSGTWLIPLNLVRTNDLTGYLSVKGRLSEDIRAIYNGQNATAVTDTLNDSPVPDMEIGKQYDFRKQQAKGNQQELAQSATSVPQVLGSETAVNQNIALVQPAEGAFLPTNLPLISGTGFAGKLVSVVIGITSPISGTTTVASDGTWQLTPAKTLAAGLQSVTITTTNGLNKPVAITHSFTVLKSGTQVLGDATPSATLAPTITPTLATTSIATPSPTSTLAGQPVPTSGTTLPTILILLFGLTLFSGGMVFVIK